MNKTLSLIIPVYNEGDVIHTTLENIYKVLDNFNINIIYDMDEDTSIPVVKQYIADKKVNNIFCIKNKYGRGALNAIKTGLEESKDEIMLVTMADLSDDMSTIHEMLEKINNGYDLVCGSRYIKGGKQIGGPFFKKLMSRIAGVSLHWLTRIPVHDITNSFKMYTKKLFKKISIESTGGFELGMEIVVKSHIAGFKVTEVPTIWYDREKGKSNFKLAAWLPKYLHWYFYAIKNIWFGKKTT